MLTCDCGYSAKGKTVNDLMKKMGVHAKKSHPELKITKKLMDAAKKKIKNV